MNTTLPVTRALLKVSGEALMGATPYGIDPGACAALVSQISETLAAGIQVGVVIGGGNIFRGVAPAAAGMDRAQADYIGMLGTIMNGLALSESFKNVGIDARVMSALPIDAVAERYARDKALDHMERGRVAIFVAGTGNPFFTADTAAALRGAEISAHAVFIGTRRPDPDPLPEPVNFTCSSKTPPPIDATAFALLRDQSLPLCIFSLASPGSFLRAARGSGSWFHPDAIADGRTLAKNMLRDLDATSSALASIWVPMPPSA